MNITENIKAILSRADLDDEAKTITLTGTLDRKDYVVVNEILETKGFKWSRKEKCHIGTVSPSEALAVILQPETRTVTTSFETAKEVKKKTQAFFTPDKLANRLLEHVELHFPYDAPPSILEPSCGNGQIVRAIHRLWPDAIVDVCEIDETARNEVAKIQGVNVVGEDFLKYDPEHKYEVIVFNVPFAKHADIIHVRKIYDHLAEGGIAVGIMGGHSFFASHKVDLEFREWLSTLDNSVYDLPSGEFKESGTMVSSKLVVIEK